MGQSCFNILVTRDSVCAGDDIDVPHEKDVTIKDILDPIELVSFLSSGYLPNINGVDHSWDCRFNGKSIARISQNGIEAHVEELHYELKNYAHFIYHSARY